MLLPISKNLTQKTQTPESENLSRHRSLEIIGTYIQQTQETIIAAIIIAKSSQTKMYLI